MCHIESGVLKFSLAARQVEETKKLLIRTNSHAERNEEIRVRKILVEKAVLVTDNRTQGEGVGSQDSDFKSEWLEEGDDE